MSPCYSSVSFIKLCFITCACLREFKSVPSRIKQTASCPEIIKSKPQWEGSLLPCFTVCTFRQCLSMNVKDLTHLWLYRTITVTTHRNLTSLGQWGSLFWDSFMGAWLVKWDGLSQHPRTARHREMSALTIQPSDSSLSGPRVCLNLCCILYIFTNVQHSSATRIQRPSQFSHGDGKTATVCQSEWSSHSCFLALPTHIFLMSLEIRALDLPLVKAAHR